MRLPRPRPALVVTGLLVAGTVIWLLDGGHRMFRPKRLGVVEEGRIWRAGQIHRRLLPDVLREHDIDVVIDLARDEGDDADEMAERQILDRLGDCPHHRGADDRVEHLDHLFLVLVDLVAQRLVQRGSDDRRHRILIAEGVAQIGDFDAQGA